MALDLEQVRTKAGRVYEGFTPGQRTVTVLAIVGILLGGVMFTRWAATPTMAPLFTGLGAQDAASITEALTAKGVRYQLTDGGASVMVPSKDVYQLRVGLSAEGLPAGDTVGYALLEEQGITTSEFKQRIDYQRALEGELSKTISAIEGVEAATVHVVMPKDDLFTDDDKHPTASVLVKTKAGQTLAPQQVQAVVHLVASSVEGLLPTQVTLADDKGTVLSAPGEDGETIAAGDTRNQQTREFERELSKSVEGMLSQVVGASGAVVEVRAQLNFDKRARVTERFDRRGVPLTNSTVRETYTGTPMGIGGVLGPDGTPAVAEGGGTDYEKRQRDQQFAVGKVTEEIKTAPGDVERLSVAVLLDDGAPAEYGTGEIEALVTAAAGLDPERGDTIQVSRIAFDRSADAAAQEELERAAAEARQAEMMGLIRTGVIVFVILLVLALAYLSMRRATKPKAEAVDIKRLQPLLDAQEEEERRALDELKLLELERELASANDTIALDQGATSGLELPPEVTERMQSHEEIAELIDNQPDEVAALLRGWLADRRS
jgi:flagellar M-ring protein FliF